MTGIAYSLFAGQPLTILGSTGPVLVFEKILFKFCKWALLNCEWKGNFLRICCVLHLCFNVNIFILPFRVFSESTVCLTSPYVCVSVCGRLFSACCWSPQTPAHWCVTSHDSQRKLLLPSSASSLFMRLWRNSSIWEKLTLSTCTITSTGSLTTRKY